MAKIIAEGNGTYRVGRAKITGNDLVQAAKEHLKTLCCNGQMITSPKMASDLFLMELGAEEQEVFVVLFMDNKHKVISLDRMFYGTVNGASVHPREVVKAALRYNAASVIFAHNHPSGSLEASNADRQITERLKQVLAIVDVKVLDHLIIGAGETSSMAEKGLI